MSEASKNMAINLANGILEMQETIAKHERTISEQRAVISSKDVTIINCSTRIDRVYSMLRHSRGMRYEDYNPLLAELENLRAVVKGWVLPKKETA